MSLRDGRLERATGWGTQFSPRGTYRLELARNGRAEVRRDGALQKDQLVVWVAQTSSRIEVQTRGGGTGVIFDEASGGVQRVLAAADRLLTPRVSSHAEVTLHAELAPEDRRTLSLSFPHLDEPEVRRLLGPALAAWMEPWVNSTVQRLTDGVDETETNLLCAQADACNRRRLLTPEQRDRLATAAQSAGGHVVAPPPTSAPPTTSPSSDRITQLKILAGLRASGALTDAEFNAEKAKLLGH